MTQVMRCRTSIGSWTRQSSNLLPPSSEQGPTRPGSLWLRLQGPCALQPRTNKGKTARPTPARRHRFEDLAQDWAHVAQLPSSAFPLCSEPPLVASDDNEGGDAAAGLGLPLYTMNWGSLTSFNIKAKVEAVFLSVLLEMPNFADPMFPPSSPWVCGTAAPHGSATDTAQALGMDEKRKQSVRPDRTHHPLLRHRRGNSIRPRCRNGCEARRSPAAQK